MRDPFAIIAFSERSRSVLGAFSERSRSVLGAFSLTMLASCAQIWGADFLDDPQVTPIGGADAHGGGGQGGVASGVGGAGGVGSGGALQGGGGGSEPIGGEGGIGGSETIPVCVEGETRDCYTGADGTEDVSPCHGGLQACGADGQWEACAGEHTPTPETCDVGMIDEDCDGETNEGLGLDCECEPGAEEACYTGLPSSTNGVGDCHGGTRFCADDGRSWGQCEGEVTPFLGEKCDSPGDQDCEGNDDAADSDCECAPIEATAPCYDGPAEQLTADALCKQGTHTCNSINEWGPCELQVLPATEVCHGDLTDEDCDGAINEGGDGCLCVPGDAYPCYSGPFQTEGVGACHAGTKTCNEFGTGYGACDDDVTPQTEVCNANVSKTGDEDCDGAINEGIDVGGAGCECAPGTVQDPSTCPYPTTTYPNTVGVGICKQATQTCNAAGTDWGFCSGQVLPKPFEDSGTPVDEDCSGSSDAITAGGYHSCAIVGETLKCWGRNTSGEVGQAIVNVKFAIPQTVSFPDGLVPLAVSAGNAHTCALVDNEDTNVTVMCWGKNDSYQLGNTGSSTHTPQLVTLPAGAAPAAAISAGGNFTCALTDDGEIYCWGHNLVGQLGDSTFTEAQSALPKKVGVGPARAVEAGVNYACALVAAGTGNKVFCWGSNTNDQLGRGSNPGDTTLPDEIDGSTTDATAISAGETHTCAISTAKGLLCWGSTANGKLGIGSTGMATTKTTPQAVNTVSGTFAAVTVSAGHNHTCATDANHQMWCWGLASSGQVGNGTFGTSPNVPALITSPDGAIAIAAGGVHSCALIDPGSPANQVWCWGNSAHDQNGYEPDNTNTPEHLTQF